MCLVWFGKRVVFFVWGLGLIWFKLLRAIVCPLLIDARELHLSAFSSKVPFRWKLPQLCLWVDNRRNGWEHPVIGRTPKRLDPILIQNTTKPTRKEHEKNPSALGLWEVKWSWWANTSCCGCFVYGLLSQRPTELHQGWVECAGVLKRCESSRSQASQAIGGKNTILTRYWSIPRIFDTKPMKLPQTTVERKNTYTHHTSSSKRPHTSWNYNKNGNSHCCCNNNRPP